MSSHRRTGPDLRGNTRDRLARKEWLKSEAAGFGGNGRVVPCYWCGSRLRKPEADRFPINGHQGGRYVRGNIVPACRRCNATRGDEGMTFREVHVDGKVVGYVEDDPRGREAADRFVSEHAKRTAETKPVTRIPQGARRLDR